MSAISVNITYRPIRVGWCVDTNSFDQLRQAFQFSSCLYGGRFNPIIPVDSSGLGSLLVKRFGVDILFPLCKKEDVEKYIPDHKWLIRPCLHDELYVGGFNEAKHCNYLSVESAFRSFYKRHIDRVKPSEVVIRLFEWEDSEPLSNVFCATFGEYPAKEITGRDYNKILIEHFGAQIEKLSPSEDVPLSSNKTITPHWMTGFDLRIYGGSIHRSEAGVYVGDPADFSDLMHFWNLRAAGISLRFYSPQHSRLKAWVQDYVRELENRPPRESKIPSYTSIWQKDQTAITIDLEFKQSVARCSLTHHSWNGLNISPCKIDFGSKTVVATEERESKPKRLTIPLPEKPFEEDIRLHPERLIASVRPYSYAENTTYRPPFISQLNEFYGRRILGNYDVARAEDDSLGAIIDATEHSLTLRSVDGPELINKVLSIFNIKAEISAAGRICKGLIDQLEGLDGARAFKVRGVRELIQKYGPGDSFTWSGAIEAIRDLDPATNIPRFKKYEAQYIDGKALTPEVVFRDLIRKRVFTAGLELICPTCELKSWVAMDSLKSSMSCQFCRNEYNSELQIKDRGDWRFRRTGLFGREKEDHQGGGIPVALTLLQFKHNLGMHGLELYSTGTLLKSTTNKFQECEADIIALTEIIYGRPQLLIGECKAHKEITDQDVKNMKAVFDAIDQELIDVFIVFSKTGEFSDTEIQRCRSIQPEHEPRIILFSARELEPYHLYDEAISEFKIERHVSRLAEMAQNTIDIYFEPKARATSAREAKP